MQVNLAGNNIGGYYVEDRNIIGGVRYISTPEGPKAIADAMRVSQSLSSINFSSNKLMGDVTETGYVKASEVQGSSFNVGDKVIYEGKEMVVSKAKDRDGDIIKMKTLPDMAGINAIADAIVRGSLSKVFLPSF